MKTPSLTTWCNLSSNKAKYNLAISPLYLHYVALPILCGAILLFPVISLHLYLKLVLLALLVGLTLSSTLNINHKGVCIYHGGLLQLTAEGLVEIQQAPFMMSNLSRVNHFFYWLVLVGEESLPTAKNNRRTILIPKMCFDRQSQARLSRTINRLRATPDA